MLSLNILVKIIPKANDNQLKVLISTDVRIFWEIFVISQQNLDFGGANWRHSPQEGCKIGTFWTGRRQCQSGVQGQITVWINAVWPNILVKLMKYSQSHPKVATSHFFQKSLQSS